MKISEFVSECQEFLANEQWRASSFYGRSLPENTDPEVGKSQSHAWQQGLPAIGTNEDVVKYVLQWTNWTPDIISVKDLCDAYMGRYEDREIQMEWT
jgi:hypothetical protein